MLRRFDGRQERVALNRAAVEVLSPTLAERLLVTVADPVLAYLLLILGAGALLVELLHPRDDRPRGRRSDRPFARALRFLRASGQLRGRGPARSCLGVPRRRSLRYETSGSWRSRA